jgi:hypothetical protein
MVASAEHGFSLDCGSPDEIDQLNRVIETRKLAAEMKIQEKTAV